MRKIHYKKLTIQNFLSVGNDTVVINFQRGMNLITGKNRDNPERVNGLGKSTMPEAFHYALFGSTIRKIKKEYIVNNVTKGKGNVELEFDVETDTSKDSYKISRQVNPSKVSISQNGEDITESSIKSNKGFIEDLIGSNSALCRGCDILSLSDNTPFMAMDAKDKRKFVEDIFALEIFGLMVKEFKTLVSKNKTDMGISSAKIEEIQNSIETIKRQAETFKKQQEERANNLKIKRETLENNIKSTKTEIESLVIPDVSKAEGNRVKLDEAWTKMDGLIGDINFKLVENKTNLKNKESELEKASRVGGVACDKCFQDISSEHMDHIAEMKSEISEKISEYGVTIEELNIKSIAAHTRKKQIQSKIFELTETINKAKMDEQKLSNLKDRLKQQIESLKDMKAEEKQVSTPVFDDSLKDTEKRKEKESDTFTLLKQYADDLDVCKFILGEEGVKSFVVKKLLGMLNSSIQGYISDLGMTMRCEFDEYFDEKMSNEKGQEISYWNLSGGERRTVDLACSWSFKDIKRKISGVSSNVEWVDEIFDSAFDERGLDLLIEVMKDRIDKIDLSVYAISHRSETYKHIDGEIINLEKDGGVTRRVEMDV